MATCAVKFCKNYTQKKENMSNITFHLFPRDPILCDQWTQIIRRSRNESYWKPKPRSCICSIHFNKNELFHTKTGRRKIRTGAVPTKALYLSSKKSDVDDDSEQSDTADDGNAVPTKPSYLSSLKCDFDDDSVKSDSADDVKISIIPNTVKSGFDPSTSSDQVYEVPIVNNPEEQIEYEICSDIDSIYDSPLEAKMRKELRRKTKALINLRRKAANLQRCNRRLKLQNESLKNALKCQKKITC